MNRMRDGWFEDVIVTIWEKIETKDGEGAPYGRIMGAYPHCKWKLGCSSVKRAIEKMQDFFNRDVGEWDTFQIEVSKYGSITLKRKVTDSDFPEILPHDAEDYYAIEEFVLEFECIKKESFDNVTVLEEYLGLKGEKDEKCTISTI